MTIRTFVLVAKDIPAHKGDYYSGCAESPILFHEYSPKTQGVYHIWKEVKEGCYHPLRGYYAKEKL